MSNRVRLPAVDVDLSAGVAVPTGTPITAPFAFDAPDWFRSSTATPEIWPRAKDGKQKLEPAATGLRESREYLVGFDSPGGLPFLCLGSALAGE